MLHLLTKFHFSNTCPGKKYWSTLTQSHMQTSYTREYCTVSTTMLSKPEILHCQCKCILHE